MNTANTVGFAGNFARDRDERGLMVFCGNANRALAESVCHELNVPLGKALVSRVSDCALRAARKSDSFMAGPDPTSGEPATKM